MSENGNGDSWYLLRTGTQSGPFAKQTIIEFVRKAELSLSDYVWRPGWEAWVQAKEVEGLFSPPSQASEAAVLDLSKEENLTRTIDHNPHPMHKQAIKANNRIIGRYEYDKVAANSYIAATICFIIVPVAIAVSTISAFMIVHFYDFLEPGFIDSITWRRYDKLFDKLFYGNLIANIIVIVALFFAAGYSSSWIVKLFFRNKVTGKFTKYVSLVYGLIWFGVVSWAYFSYGVSTDLLIWIFAFFGLKEGLEMGNNYFRPKNIALN